MGCGASRKADNVTDNPHKKSDTPTSQTNIKISAENLVGNRKGNVGDDYHMMQTLGQGAFGEVKKIKHKRTGLYRACKIIRKQELDAEDLAKLHNEVEILKRLDHPNIMKVIETYEDKRHFYVITELFEGKELFDEIVKAHNFGEKDAAKIMKQILSAVNYCHQNGVVHRDLKPENIIFESKKQDSILKVIDFGTSTAYDPAKKMTQKHGTPYYVAPEVLRQNYDEKCDIWSCGVIMYILLCGSPPFNGNDDNEIMKKVLKGNFTFDKDEFQEVSEEAKSLIMKLLTYIPDKRINAEKALQDKWFKKYLDDNAIDKPLAMKALKNLKTFQADQKLQEATWIFLVNYLATREERNELLKTFQALDLNGDGKLTKEEIITGYRDILGSSTPEEDADAILKSIDNNNSGTIDYSEFVMATINRQNLLSKERLETAFKLFDKDGNGYITREEIKEMLDPQKSKGIDDATWAEWIKEVDQNSDGKSKISLSEFKTMMVKLVK